MAAILSLGPNVLNCLLYMYLFVWKLFFFNHFLSNAILFLPQDVSMAYCKRHNSIANALELPSSL